jgi:hypothetical protein
MRTLSKREEHIKLIFLPTQKSESKKYLSEEEVFEIIDRVSEMGRNIGFVGLNVSKSQEKEEQRKHKFDVWIAKEIKKNLELLKKETEFRLIVDWASETKCNLFDYDFDAAVVRQKEWHRSLMETLEIEEMAIPNIDPSRVLYRCSDKRMFFYLLKQSDLKYEGKMMANCVGGGNYNARIKSGKNIYVSLRDENNEPHITTEIDTSRNAVIQLLGKTNLIPKKEYLEKVLEFILFYTNYSKLPDRQSLKYLKINNLF